ncbi:hypothetical protein Dimus_011762 [Dionaea muscipula]
MEFVGRNVMKEFSGYGVFKGVVESYDSSSGYFRIVYEDGDSEEVDLSEVSLLIRPSGSVPADEKVKKPGRKSKRRRRIWADSGTGFNNSAKSSGISEIEGGLGGNLNKYLPADGNLVRVVSGEKMLDLNLDDGLNSDDGLHVNVDSLENGGVRGFIDLNLTVDNELGNRLKGDDPGCPGKPTEKVKRGFDLNIGLNDESLDVDGEDETLECVKHVNGGSVCCNGTSAESLSTEHACSEGCVHSCEELKLTSRMVVDADNVNRRNGNIELKESSSVTISGSPYEDGNSRCRKKRKVEDNSSSPSVTALRRSVRWTRAMAFQVNNSSKVVADGYNDISSSVVSVVTEEKPTVEDCEGVEVSEALPPVLELPPSSTNLNLDELSVLDVFSVYACLRSFSTLLYLSPFELEDLVGALKSNISNPLLDFIHVSLLQTLRKHLEFLSSEGSESASNCLRNLNWDLLDIITWPIFMVEYLLIHGPGSKLGFNLASLKLFENDYYKQPAEVKIQVLRCLCDDAMEVDSIRSELNRRSTLAEFGVDIDRNMNNNVIIKRRPSKNALVDCGTGDDIDEVTTDYNSDECYLCKMDGNLICCDGCPAAYHSRCVGVVSNRLPEGEWYCPECSIGRQNSGMKPQKLIRGAEPLGVDPYGRLYFSSCGYLLVSDSCDVDCVFRYYNRNDLSLIIESMRSSGLVFGSILGAISERWALHTGSNLEKSSFDSPNLTSPISSLVSEPIKASISSNNLVLKDEVMDAETLDNPDVVDCAIVKANTEMEKQANNYEGLAEVLQASRPAAKHGRKKSLCAGHCSKSSLVKSKEEAPMEMQSQSNYMNNYDFARTASSVAEELTRTSSEKVNPDFSNSEEEIISIQLKVILKKSSKLCWLGILNLDAELQKEKCGWCYACRSPAEGRDCLFNMRHTDFVSEGLKTEIAGIMSKQSRKGHLIDVMCYVLSLEDRLQGLLLDPWLSPHYSNFWRTNVLEASDVATVKYCLLMLEANLHPRALSAEWSKHVDSAATMGSASHIVITSRVASRLGLSRKRCQGVDPEPTSRNGTGGLVLFWWRGGRLSRKVFNWKVLPKSLASKAARKGGCVKIPGILYSDGSEHTKRSKHVVWRAAVEASTSVEQLALLVRELDQNIRWDDIEKTHLLSLLDNESKKSIRLFKKVIVRRKTLEGTIVRYLLDFGKRRIIPDVVVRHGKMLEDSSERKKYWLDESYLPLHLLKGFEEKKIARKASKINSTRAPKNKVVKTPFRRKGLEYLVSRAERAENYQCGHCKKDVPIRDAVSCRRCCGFFHKRHVRKLSGTNAAKCPFVCHTCLAGEQVMIGKRVKKKKIQIVEGGGKVFSKGKRGRKRFVQISQDGKSVYFGKKRGRKPKSKKGERSTSSSYVSKQQVLVENTKEAKEVHGQMMFSEKSANVSPGVSLRRSSRILKSVSGQYYSGFGEDKKKEEKQTKAGTVSSKKPSQDVHSWSWKRKRTPTCSAFWINGLKLCRKPNDELIVHFKRTKLLPCEFSATATTTTTTIDQPKCPLCCEESYTSALKYIACEKCGGWFHGHAFGLDAQNVEHLIGFRCHLCLRRDPPPRCPPSYLEDAKSNSSILLHEAVNGAETEVADKLPEEAVIAIPMETNSSSSSLKFGSYNNNLPISVQNLVKSTPDNKSSSSAAYCETEPDEKLSEDAIVVPMETAADSQKKPGCPNEDLQVSLKDLVESMTDDPVVKSKLDKSCLDDQTLMQMQQLEFPVEEARNFNTADDEAMISGILLEETTPLDPPVQTDDDNNHKSGSSNERLWKQVSMQYPVEATKYTAAASLDDDQNPTQELEM